MTLTLDEMQVSANDLHRELDVMMNKFELELLRLPKECKVNEDLVDQFFRVQLLFKMCKARGMV